MVADGLPGGEGLAFGLDQPAGSVASNLGGGSDVIVAFDGNGTEEDVGEEEGKETQDLASTAGGEDRAVDFVEFGVGVGKGVEVLTQTSNANNVEGRS